jgi:3-methyladenine DNA glycosylase AlkD
MQTVLGRDVARALKAHADPQRAQSQQAYMKSAIPYRGVSMPEVRRIARTCFAQQPCGNAQAWEATARDLWEQAGFREERYVAIELLDCPRYRKAWLTPHCLPLLEDMARTGAWWDYVDAIATRLVHHLLSSHPQPTMQRMYALANHEDLWLRRTSIICQLKRREHTDLDLLTQAISGSMHDTDFFARKAIGWALRAYGETDPRWVVSYVRENADRLSTLSKREALRRIPDIKRSP